MHVRLLGIFAVIALGLSTLGVVRSLQQRVFNRFRRTYNELRPHEELDDEPPASCWGPSPRPYPEGNHVPGHFVTYVTGCSRPQS